MKVFSSDFAKNVLGVKPVAKCYKQNKASYGMITGAGFEKCGEDETFYQKFDKNECVSDNVSRWSKRLRSLR